MSDIEEVHSADMFLGYLPIKDQVKQRDRYASGYETHSSLTERGYPVFQVTRRVNTRSEFDEILSRFCGSPFVVWVEATWYGEFAIIELNCEKNGQSMRLLDIAVALRSEEFDAVLAAEGTSLEAWAAFYESIKPRLLPMEQGSERAS